MGKIATLGLSEYHELVNCLPNKKGENHTKDFNRAERSEWYVSESSERGRSLSTRRAIVGYCFVEQYRYGDQRKSIQWYLKPFAEDASTRNT